MLQFLEIYHSFENGQKKQYLTQVKEYGVESFIEELEERVITGRISDNKAYELLRTFIFLNYQ